jgi:oxaloacetate decarboxylase alpha subunit
VSEIDFVDHTIRDAQQSLWAFRMRSDMIFPIAPIMDRVGFKAIGTIGPRGFNVAIRLLHENPWERIRFLSKALQRTPLRTSVTTTSVASFGIESLELNALWIKRCVANGIKCFWFCDYQTVMDRTSYLVKVAKAEGAEVSMGLMYTDSPAHTDEFFAQSTRRMMELKDYIDVITIEDAGGVLTPERTRTFLSAILQNCNGIPVELHVHCNTGLGPLCYLEALRLGIKTVHVAVAPLANGTSLPSTENILRNARYMGFSSNLDEEALKAMSDHFREVAQKEGMPIGAPVEYDLYYYKHQVPGGMMTNLKRQLAELEMEQRLDEVLEEVPLVRKELGYPVMATPFSQIVGAVALSNVVAGKRYQVVSDEVILYVLGYYGEPPAPIDQNIKDKITSLPRAKALRNWEPPSVADLRAKYGSELSDDDLLLKVIVPK